MATPPVKNILKKYENIVKKFRQNCGEDHSDTLFRYLYYLTPYDIETLLNNFNCKKTDRNPTGDDSKKWGHSKENIEKSNRISYHVHETTGPADMATRAQAASTLMRFDQNVVEN